LSSGSIIGSNSLGKIGKPAEKVGLEAAENLLIQLEKSAPIDKYLADQLIPYMSIADGRSEIMTTELSLHTLACIEVSKIILNIDFKIKGELGESALIECDGIGLKNSI
jgi:RNA 3'-terminal phosphate cyclase (ATP)